MLKYHGTPMSGTRADVRQFLTGRHALIPFFRQDDLQLALQVCQSVIFDTSAYTLYKQRQDTSYFAYYQQYVDWVRQYKHHPRFAWAIIPDAINPENPWENEIYRKMWPDDLRQVGVPVYHLDEPDSKLEVYCKLYERVAIAPGAYRGNIKSRLEEVLPRIMDKNGQPIARLHGLKLQDVKVFTSFPFASTDSTNVARNTYRALDNNKGSTPAEAANYLATRVEAYNSPGCWHDKGKQLLIF